MPQSFSEFVETMRTLGAKPKKKFKPFAPSFYPMKVERELYELLKKEFGSVCNKIYATAFKGVSLNDDLSDLSSLFFELKKPFSDKVDALASEVVRSNVQNMANFSNAVLGEKFFVPPPSKGVVENWKAKFIETCSSFGTTQKERVANEIQKLVGQGASIPDVKRKIKQTLTNVSEYKAKLIARTETAHLNSALKRDTYSQCGIQFYQWLCTMDERSRHNHIAMNGLICSVDNPDVYYTFEKGKMETHQRTPDMVHLHAGEDFNCRCVMCPYDPEIDEAFEEERKENVKQATEKLGVENPENVSTPKPTASPEIKPAPKPNPISSEGLKKVEELENKFRIQKIAEERHAKRTPERVKEIRKAYLEKVYTRKKTPEYMNKHIANLPEETAVRYKQNVDKIWSEYDYRGKILFDNLEKKNVKHTWLPASNEGGFTRALNKLEIGDLCCLTNKRGSGQTFYHELGHAIDYHLGKEKLLSEELDLFSKANEDVLAKYEARVEKVLKEIETVKKNPNLCTNEFLEKIRPFTKSYVSSLSKTDFLHRGFMFNFSKRNILTKYIEEDIRLISEKYGIKNDSLSSIVSDTICAVKKGYVKVTYGHSVKYYKESDNRNAEIFTHNLTAFRNKNLLKAYREFFPETSAFFEEEVLNKRAMNLPKEVK